MTDQFLAQMAEQIEDYARIFQEQRATIQERLDSDLARLDERNSSSPLIQEFLKIRGVACVSELDHEGKNELVAYLVNSLPSHQIKNPRTIQ